MSAGFCVLIPARLRSSRLPCSGKRCITCVIPLVFFLRPLARNAPISTGH